MKIVHDVSRHLSGMSRDITLVGAEGLEPPTCWLYARFVSAVCSPGLSKRTGDRIPSIYQLCSGRTREVSTPLATIYPDVRQRHWWRLHHPEGGTLADWLS